MAPHVPVTDPTSRKPGRPMDRGRDQAILTAALSCLSDVGYDRLTMDEVAARAHTSKATIYRRWPSKASLVVDAVRAWREQLAPTATPNTGSFTDDLDAMVALIPDFDEARRRQLAVIAGLVSAAGRDPELRTALSTLFEEPRNLLGEILARAVERGEIAPDCDIELVADALVGLNLLRSLLGDAPDRRFADRVVRRLLLPLVTPGSSPQARP